jgi:hypothetical protein
VPFNTGIDPMAGFLRAPGTTGLENGCQRAHFAAVHNDEIARK